MELLRLTETQLMDSHYIHPRKINFFNDMDGKMIAGNIGGILTPVQSYLEPAGNNYKNYYNDFATSLVNKESARIVTDGEIAIIKPELHQVAKEVDFRSGLKSAIGHQIFPEGLAYINGITKTNITERMTVIAAGLMANAGLYPGLGVSVTNLKITYTTDRTNYLNDLGIVGTKRTNLESLEMIYNEAFSDAVGDLSKLYRHEPGMAASYWNQTLLLPYVSHTHEHFNGIMAAGELITVRTREFFDNTQIKVGSLTAAARISAGIVIAPIDPFTDPLTVVGIKNRTGNAWTHGGETGTILMLKNESPGPAKWDIDIID